MLLQKNEIFAAQDIEVKSVEVPEWKGSVGLKLMNGLERDEYEQFVMDRSDKGSKDLKGVRVELLIRTLCNEEGVLVFDRKDIAELNKKSANAINTLFEEAAKVNGIVQGYVEDAEKNS